MASLGDIMVVIMLLLIPIILLIIIKLYKRYKNIKIHDAQLFLFKLKRLGLSNFQIKIVNNLIGILRLTNPNTLLTKPESFESVIGRFLVHVRASGEDEESLAMICRDITIIYDKLYHPAQIKKPLKSIQDIDENQLISFTVGASKVFLGKIIFRNSESMHFKIFGNIAELKPGPNEKIVRFRLFRPGDAEYTFETGIMGREGNNLILSIPDDIKRGEETRHPYIDVIIQAQLIRIGPLEDDEEKISCTIYKLNNYEAVLRTGIKLDHNSRYTMEFTVLDFTIKVVSKILTEKTVEESGLFYYTLKFEEISDSANHVLNTYMHEHL